ncbi:stage II sporulation protein P [Fictibacillus sp. S7]|uniref:stage II sporulation protein P n=1 Tax=Fictibacillus sp. S7 TaxID=2212476 RepID=UPI001011C746|nr:stage II sporulation protein P [Fictibacillus sp. S7]RXZ02165.1 stage II sporulation protein P [Fictibacillus sp. S7]
MNYEHAGFRKIFVSVAGLLTFLVVSIIIITSFEEKYKLSSSTLNTWLNTFSGEALVYLMGLENGYYTQLLPKESRPPKISNVLFELATNIKPGDNRSLLGRELPGFSLYDSTILVAGEGTNYSNLTVESVPQMKLLKSLEDAPVKDIQTPTNQNTTDTNPPLHSTNGKKVAFIYHTHSWESFLPHLKGVTDVDKSIHSKVNITMVGKRLGEELEKRGIGTAVDTTDMADLLRKNNTNYYKAYPMSRTIVETAMAQNKNLNFFFDLHRDNARRQTTTTTINGKTYARIFFVIGEGNPNYEKNEQMARELNTIIENKYKGLSRGIISKKKSRGTNGIYNQDLSNNSIIIEMGGVDNTFEELYNTAEAVADAISDYYWKVEKVSGN